MKKFSSLARIILLILCCSIIQLIPMSVPFVINQPGEVLVGTSLSFSLKEAGQACVIIDSDNVVLDLNNFSINQVSGKEQSNTIGILITPNKKNIEIKNGTISNMTSYGIFSDTNVDSVKFTNISINSAFKAGILISPESANIIFNKVSVENITDNEGNDAHGFFCDTANIIEITNCLITNIQASTGNAYGFTMNNCTSLRFGSCDSSYISAEGANTIGYNFINSDLCLLTNCSSSYNSNPNKNSLLTAAFNFERSHNIIANNCSSFNNTGYGTTCGYRFNNCSIGQISFCQTINNVSTSATVVGYYAENSLGLTFNECKSQNNISSINAYGFLCETTQSSIIENCMSSLNMGNQKGFGIALVDTSKCYIKKNTAIDNIGSENSYGIFDNQQESTTNKIWGNIAFLNTTNYEPSSPAIPVFIGPLTDNPSRFENISL